MALTKPGMMFIELDGTLVDSVPGFAWYFDETMKTLGLPTRHQAIVDSLAELKRLF